MTIELCQATCDRLAYGYAGLEDAQQCCMCLSLPNFPQTHANAISIVCDSAIRNGAAATSDGLCNMACFGNATEICGGGNRISLYKTINWSLGGCYTDIMSARTLSYLIVKPHLFAM
jgi:hypothetical protein